MLMNDKIMFDRYYCINSTNASAKTKKRLADFIFKPYHIFFREHAFVKLICLIRAEVKYLLF